MKNFRLEKLKINNFKSIKNLELDFGKNGLLLVVGPNGAGKSSLIEAIYWSIYKDTLYGQKADEILSFNAKKDCKVETHFRLEEDLLKIKRVRTHSRKKIFELKFKDETYNENEISTFFPSKDIFLNGSIFLKDSKKTQLYVLNASDTKRMEYFDDILGTKHFPEYKKAANQMKKELELESAALNEKIDELKKIYEERKARLEESKKELDRKKKEKEKRVEELEEEIKKCRKALENIPIYEKEKEEIQKKLLKLVEIVEALRKKKIKLEEELKLILRNKEEIEKEFEQKKKDTEEKISSLLESLLNKETSSSLEEFKEDFELLDFQISMHLKSLRDREKEFQKAYKELQKKEEEIEKLQEFIDNSRKEAKKKTKENEDAKSILNKKLESSSQIEKLFKNSSCPLCGSKKIEKEKKLELEEKLSKLKKEAAILNKEIEKRKIEIEELEKKEEKNLEKLKKKKKFLLEKRRELEKEYKESSKRLRDKISFFEKQKEELKENQKKKVEEISFKLKKEFKEKKEIELAELEKKKKEELEEISKNISRLNRRIYIVSQKEAYYFEKQEKAQKKKEKKTRQLAEAHVLSKELDKKIEELRALEKEDFKFLNTFISKEEKKIEEDLSRIKKLSKEETEIKEEIERLNFWKNAFSAQGIKSYLFANFLPSLNELCNFFSLRLTDGKISLKFVQTDNGCKPEISKLGSSARSLSTFSSGEKSLISLISFLSISRFFEQASGRTFPILCFDEVFDSLDEENSIKVAKALKALSEDFLILLISHSPIWKNLDLTDNVLDFYDRVPRISPV